MVTAGHCSILLAAALFLPTSTVPARDPADYQVGDIVEEDIIAPVPLTIIDEAGTAELRRREAERLPVLLRFYTNASRDAEIPLRAAFASTRSNFLNAVQAAFNRRQLEAPDLASDRFQRLALMFQIRNLLYPAGTNLAGLWAAGRPDQAVLDSVTAKLREAMKRPIVGTDALPPELRPGGTARLIPLADTNEIPTLPMAGFRGIDVAVDILVPLRRAQEEFTGAFPPAESVLGEYLGSFLRPNCVVDEELTRQLRAERVSPVLAAGHYAAGEVIASRGEAVTPKIKAALSQLKEAAAVAELEQRLRATQLKAARATRLLIGGGIGVAAICGVILWRTRRRPAPAAPAAPAAAEGTPAPAPRRRIRLPKLAALVPVQSLGQFLKRIVARVFRRPARSGEETAPAHELDDRLMTIHSRMQDQLLVYERRIAELEKQLATRTDASRDLVQKELETLRHQLAIERARPPFEADSGKRGS